MNTRKQEGLESLRQRISEIIDIGAHDDLVSRGYDLLSILIIVLNLAVSLLDTFAGVRAQYASLLALFEWISILFFTVDYLLRLWCAKYLYRKKNEEEPGFKPVLRYVFSFAGIIDLLSFLPYYLPFVFPGGAIAFRMFRVARILRLFRINAYYDSLNVITQVLVSKSTQLLSALFIIIVLIIASSLCMYSLEHQAQPEVFTNAFSGIWWAAATMFTVGYGDIYPITPMGQAFSIAITFLGVGMVAIPTGIISAGFVEQYSRIKRLGEKQEEEDIHFLKCLLQENDPWTGKRLSAISLPEGLFFAAVFRDKQLLTPDADPEIKAKDLLVIGARHVEKELPVHLRRLRLREKSDWIGLTIGELDISRQAAIVMVEREGQGIRPEEELVLKEGDEVLLFSRHPFKDSETELV